MKQFSTQAERSIGTMWKYLEVRIRMSLWRLNATRPKVNAFCEERGLSIYLWSVIHNCANLPGNVNQLLDFATSWWRWWLHLLTGWCSTELISCCPHTSQRKPPKQMDWPCWITWLGVLQLASNITRPNCLWLFGGEVHMTRIRFINLPY